MFPSRYLPTAGLFSPQSNHCRRGNPNPSFIVLYEQVKKSLGTLPQCELLPRLAGDISSLRGTSVLVHFDRRPPRPCYDPQSRITFHMVCGTLDSLWPQDMPRGPRSCQAGSLEAQPHGPLKTECRRLHEQPPNTDHIHPTSSPFHQTLKPEIFSQLNKDGRNRQPGSAPRHAKAAAGSRLQQRLGRHPLL